MFGLIVRLVLNALALLAVPYVVHGVHLQGFGHALVVALILGIVNAIIRPIVFLLTLPAVILTLGLFTFIINALMLELVAHLPVGLHIDSFWDAILGAIVLTVVSWILSALIKTGDDKKLTLKK